MNDSDTNIPRQQEFISLHNIQQD